MKKRMQSMPPLLGTTIDYPNEFLEYNRVPKPGDKCKLRSCLTAYNWSPETILHVAIKVPKTDKRK